MKRCRISTFRNNPSHAITFTAMDIGSWNQARRIESKTFLILELNCILIGASKDKYRKNHRITVSIDSQSDIP